VPTVSEQMVGNSEVAYWCHPTHSNLGSFLVFT